MQITGLGGDQTVTINKTTFYNFCFVWDHKRVVFVDITVSTASYTSDTMSVRVYEGQEIVDEWKFYADKRIDEARVFIESGDNMTAAETVVLMMEGLNNGV